MDTANLKVITARSFQTPNDLSRYQMNRAVAEAVRVQFMNGEDRFAWLAEKWGRLQSSAESLFPDRPLQALTARCYKSMDEKNQFDQNRELEFALALAVGRIYNGS